MNKKLLFFIFALIIISQSLFSQNNHQQHNKNLFKNSGEIYFKFVVEDFANINNISKYVSVDKVKGMEVYAYSNEVQFQKFSQLGFELEILPHPGTLLKDPKMVDVIDVKNIEDWDFYPTYEGYVSMMYQFAADYPNICEIFSIGQTTEGRELLFVRISDNIGVEEGEAKVMYTATMHGDEVTGYVLSLRLINYLLENYGSNNRITNMVNNLDIFINPLANPDGTYAGGNGSVNGATRTNANWVDLNRNYPDIDEGPHPDGNDWQIETIHFMQLAEDYNFLISANYHGGSEVFNYPWDTWYQRHADDDWWYYVGREFADTIHIHAPSGYFTFMDNGVTDGYDWYSISGGRQDYMNGFHNCREVTLEISDDKMPPANQLPNYWEYLYRSMINYFEQAYYGIQGTVTDFDTGDPIKAKIFIENHDDEYSFVYGDIITGKYYRPIKEGTYSVTVSAPCYISQTFNNISVEDYQTTILDVQLVSADFLPEFEASKTNVQLGESINFSDLSCGNPTSWEWTFEGAIPATSTDQNPENILYSEAGVYDVTLTISDGTNTETTVKEDYISVSIEYTMEDATVTTCQGLFYDSGGESGSYQNDEDYTMTFLPGEINGKIICNFLSFSIEENATCDWDWLKIYDGESVSSPLIGTYCGTDSPGEIIASSESGALTFVFHSDYSVTESGWMADITCDNTSDTDIFINKHIIISPNPATNFLRIQAEEQIKSYELINISGSMVMHSNNLLKKEVNIDISQIPDGIYLVRVYSDSNIYSSKILIH